MAENTEIVSRAVLGHLEQDERYNIRLSLEQDERFRSIFENWKNNYGKNGKYRVKGRCLVHKCCDEKMAKIEFYNGGIFRAGIQRADTLRYCTKCGHKKYSSNFLDIPE